MLKNVNDIAGGTCGEITIDSFSHYTQKQYGKKLYTQYFYNCTCSCGKKMIVNRSSLISKSIKSCGHSKYDTKLDLTDIIDKRFGDLLVLSYDHKENNNRHHYKCKCLRCGKEFVAERIHIINHARACPECAKKKIKNLNDIVGNKYNKLYVVKYDHEESRLSVTGLPYKQHMYLCKCDCGNEKVIERHQIVSGGTKSCGCYAEESSSKINYRHGMYNTKFYRTWQNMKTRCTYPSHKAYPDYGGRGIKVCDRWLGENGFEHFKEDMYDKYLEKAEELGGEQYVSLDRINVDGNYEPGNCRWASKDQQVNNTRSNVYVEYNSEKLTLKQCVEKYSNIPYRTVLHRYREESWSLEDALYTPVKPEVKRFYNNEYLTLKNIYDKYHTENSISYGTFFS